MLHASWLGKQNSQEQRDIPVLLNIMGMGICSGLLQFLEGGSMNWKKNTEKQCESGNGNHKKLLQMNEKKFYLRRNYFPKIQIPWHCWYILPLELYSSQDIEKSCSFFESAYRMLASTRVTDICDTNTYILVKVSRAAKPRP